MKEPLSNIRAFCKRHAPKPVKFHPKDVLPGCFVKRAFKSKVGPKVEHMWVRVERVDYDRQLIYGRLANEPLYAWDFKPGDKVRVKFSQVEALEDECFGKGG